MAQRIPRGNNDRMGSQKGRGHIMIGQRPNHRDKESWVTYLGAAYREMRPVEFNLKRAARSAPESGLDYLGYHHDQRGVSLRLTRSEFTGENSPIIASIMLRDASPFKQSGAHVSTDFRVFAYL